MLPPKPTATSPPARRGGEAAERVIVAVKAEKDISKSGLAWALTHTARPGDCITLLAVFSEHKTGGKRFWGFPRLKGDCRSCDPTKLPDRIFQISEACSNMVLQVQDQIKDVLHDTLFSSRRGYKLSNLNFKARTVRVRIKAVSVIDAGAVAAEAKSSAATWVILDKKLKRELKHCIDELHCNIVVMKGSHPKVLRLNLAASNNVQTPSYSTASSPTKDGENLCSYNMKYTTPVSSPEDPTTSYTRTSGENSISSPDTGTSIFFVYEQNPLYEGLNKYKNQPNKQNSLDHASERATNSGGDYAFDSSIREAVSLSKTSSNPPPLCSLCQSKVPAFGKPPKQFHYKELEEATDDFSETNVIGGFGLVHRGVLRNGLIIAVKQLRLVGPERDDDFCREVRVLSCAQHRNVVLLIGFCIEGKKRLLVYEFICNSSLDFHLHGNGMLILDWLTRLKIAIGTAKGLRYLHEDCRVGCIIHRNLRPNNILLTHDFEPLVADFGPARLHSEWDFSDKNQAVGTSGYLAPEYFNNGKMTEKVDIYAFGLVLLELITGQRAHNLQYCMDHQFLLDNIHSLAAIEPIHILAYKHQLLDPRLASFQRQGFPHELHAMGCAATLCLQQDPELRPSMSKVVKMLERGSPATPLALDLDSVGCRSGHMQGLHSKRRHSRRLSY